MQPSPRHSGAAGAYGKKDRFSPAQRLPERTKANTQAIVPYEASVDGDGDADAASESEASVESIRTEEIKMDSLLADALKSEAQAPSRPGKSSEAQLEAAARAQGLEVQSLEAPEVLPQLLEDIRMLEKMTASKLVLEYERLGYAADDLMCRTELMGLVRDALVWSEMSASALAGVCAKRGLEVDTDQSRGELQQLLADSTWEALGIPVSRLPDKEAATRVLEQVRGLENCSISELGAMCRRWGLPAMAQAAHARVTPERLVAQLRQVSIWRELPAAELRLDCRARSLELPASLSNRDSPEVRRELQDRLLDSLQTCTPEMRGVPSTRLGKPEVVEEVLRELDRLQTLGPLSLKAECYRRNVVHNPVMERQALVDRLRDVLVWSHLPLEALQEECHERKVFILSSDPRDVLINSLLEAQDRSVEMVKLGVPAQLIHDERARELVEEWKQVETMTVADLLPWYEDMGLPCASNMTRHALMCLMKKAMAWEILPLTDLRRECNSRLGTTSDLDEVSSEGNDDDEQQQQQQQQQLVFKLLLNESLDFMNVETLLEWYGSMDLPDLGTPEKAGLQKLLRQILAWESSTLATLRGECQQRGISDSVDLPAEGGQEVEQQEQQVLVRRLTLHECLEVMSMEALRDWYEGLGLPPFRSLKCTELQAFLRKVLGWQEMAPAALWQECHRECPELEERQREQLQKGQEEEEEDQLRQRLLSRCALLGCIEALPTDDLEEWYQTMGHPVIVPGMKRKELQRLLRKAVVWEALPLAELRQRCAEVTPSPCDTLTLPEDEERPRLVQLLVQNERIEGMSPMDLAEWYKSCNMPLERSTKRTDLQKLLRKVMFWRSLPLMDLQEECERLGLMPDDVAECDEDEQRTELIQRLFFSDRIEVWDARGFQAKRIGSTDSVLQVVRVYSDFEQMDEASLKQSYGEAGLPETRGMSRDDCLETLRALLIWQALPLEELLSEAEERGLGCPPGNEEEQREILIDQLVAALRPRSRAPVSSSSARSRAPRGVRSTLEPEQELLLKEPQQPPAPEPALAASASASSPARASVLGSATGRKAEAPARSRAPAPIMRQREEAVADSIRDRTAATASRFSPKQQELSCTAAAASEASSQGAQTAATQVPPRLAEGITLLINLERRTDRRKKMEQLIAPHAWLRSSLQRVPAVDGQLLDINMLVADGSFTRQAVNTAQRAVKERRATIGATPQECSTHLTPGGFGCALSHKKAWETLVNSNSRWALILEDDLTGICANFDEELNRVFSQLPADWNMCYLGFHTGKMIPAGAHFRGPLKQLGINDGWLPGLWGYLISKVCARGLLRQVFPITSQVDTEVGCRVMQKPGCFVVPEKEFLLFSPPTESSNDTDVQTFERDMR